MTIEQMTAVVAVVAACANAAVTYYNLYYTRRKDFQDKLFQLKLDAYKELNEACYKATVRLDVNSSPFVEIYDYKDKEEWQAYYQPLMSEQINESLETKELVYKYAFMLPADIVEKYLYFFDRCLSFVKVGHHFDTGLLVDAQDELRDLYTDLTIRFRKDLNIDSIDWGLRNRISW